MQFPRPFAYLVTRLLRMGLPVFVSVLLVVAFFNYASRRAATSGSETTVSPLPDTLKARADGGYTFSRMEEGRTVLTVHARSSLVFKNNENRLDEVEITIASSSDESASRIRSRSCVVDLETSDMRCEGDVDFRFDGFRGQSAELRYDSRLHTVFSPQRTHMTQAASVTADSNNLKYDLDSDRLKLDGNVTINAGGVLIHTPTATIHRTDRGVRSGDRNAEDSGRALDPTGSPLWKFRGDAVDIAMSGAGVVRQVNARGNAEVQEFTGRARKLTGADIDAVFDANGQFASLSARTRSLMMLGPDLTLSSDQIHTVTSGLVETAGSSVFKAGEA